MVGAVLAHLFIHGPSVVPAVILGLICAAVIYVYYAQIKDPLGHVAA